jgi:hypothetical protein
VQKIPDAAAHGPEFHLVEIKMREHAYASLLVLGIPIGVLFAGSVLLFLRKKAISSVLQLMGASGLMIVLLEHIAEAFSVFPEMQWGAEHSPGHYLDLASAGLGLLLFPIGYLLHALSKPGPVQ